jgi:heat-inducible transcriptional repressor
MVMDETTDLLDQRKKRILFALVQEYVSTAQPVGSGVLARAYGLEMSPATVRHELALLEDLGYLVQPHVSAGRVPTDKTYRLFVDSLIEGEGGLPAPERAAIAEHYAALRAEVDGLMRETSALLSRLTRSVAVVLAPNLGRSRLKHVDLVRMAEQRVMVVLITDTGRVVSSAFELARPITAEDLAGLEAHVNRHLTGLDPEGVGRERLRLYAIQEAQAELLGQIVDTIIATLKAEHERVFMVGASNLLRQPEFEDPGVAMPVLDLAERSAALFQLIGNAVELHHVFVSIGAENSLPETGNISVVATGYGVGEEPYGALGLLGPTRMDYARVIATVRCVAENLSESLRALHS